MNKDLMAFIDLCLIDGAISEKERKVIFAKAKELGVGKDECDVLIESLTQKKSKTTTKPTIKKREFEPKTIKSIPPAPLNNENKLNSNINSNNEKLLILSKQEAEEIKKIKQSNQEIVDKINALRVELESFQKTHNEKKTQIFAFAGIEWRATNFINLDDEQSKIMLEVLNTLEGLDDVQNIFTNANLKLKI